MTAPRTMAAPLERSGALLSRVPAAVRPAFPRYRETARGRLAWYAAVIGVAFGLLVLAWLPFGLPRGLGYDTYSYWRVPHGPTLYAGTEVPTGWGPFRYAPAFAQVLSPLWVLPWEAFLGLWIAFMAVCYFYVARRWWLLLLAFLPVTFELWQGNINLQLAAAIVLGFEFPVAWAFLLLTKMTPGVALVWFAARGEWRRLAIALGATAAIVAVSAAVFGVGPWLDWIASLRGSKSADWTLLTAVPLSVRLAAAAVLVAWAARGDRRWAVPIAVFVSLGSPSIAALSILVAAFRLSPAGRRAAEARPIPAVLGADLPAPAAT